ncbi:MAG TPA: S-adenosylmethionine:tRNA ribosyltransferase-isomerase [Kofleriaceae bacterium]|nr:S-adenosylmethionine:tRNA ribosyltransferase-isomerase [Kofleriaceae bacterium]
MSARAYRRYASLARHEDVRGRGGTNVSAPRTDDVLRGAGVVALKSDEVSRHAVRLVSIARGDDRIAITRFAKLPELLRAGDLVVVNDAATLPGSLRGETSRGEPFELRLSGPIEADRLVGVLFGPGDHRTRTEYRPAPPSIPVGEHVLVGALTARVTSRIGRRVELVTDETGAALWQAIYASGAPVQYAHRSELLPLYAVQTAYAARPWAAEMPSAGRPLTWEVLLGLRRSGVEIASLTHAAGLSSTGDDELDRALPWPERYEIPRRTVELIAATRARGGRVIAIGTTVVRALESAAVLDGKIEAGSGIATLRLDADYPLRVVDGLVSGLHSPGESHFDLLSAFAPRERLARAIELAAAEGLSSHELGDTCLIL